jgi:hypothetical protein
VTTLPRLSSSTTRSGDRLPTSGRLFIRGNPTSHSLMGLELSPSANGGIYPPQTVSSRRSQLPPITLQMRVSDQPTRCMVAVRLG